jgi:hypothetical protein
MKKQNEMTRKNEMILNEIETRDYCLLDGRLLLGETADLFFFSIEIYYTYI